MITRLCPLYNNFPSHCTLTLGSTTTVDKQKPPPKKKKVKSHSKVNAPLYIAPQLHIIILTNMLTTLCRNGEREREWRVGGGRILKRGGPSTSTKTLHAFDCPNAIWKMIPVFGAANMIYKGKEKKKKHASDHDCCNDGCFILPSQNCPHSWQP